MAKGMESIRFSDKIKKERLVLNNKIYLNYETMIS